MEPASAERWAQSDLIWLARIWCDKTGNKMSATGRRIVKDSKFFPNLIDRYEAGARYDTQGSFTLRVYDKVVAWFHNPANWPDGTIPSELTDSQRAKETIYAQTQRLKEQAERSERTAEAAQKRKGGKTGSQGEKEGGTGGAASSLLAKLRSVQEAKS